MKPAGKPRVKRNIRTDAEPGADAAEGDRTVNASVGTLELSGRCREKV